MHRRRRNYMPPQQGRPARRPRGGGRDLWPMTESDAEAAIARFFSVALKDRVTAEAVARGALKDAADAPHATYDQLIQLFSGRETDNGAYGSRQRVYQRPETLPGAFVVREVGSLVPYGVKSNIPNYEMCLDRLVLPPDDPDDTTLRRVIGVSVGVPGMWLKSPSPDPIRGFGDEDIMEGVAYFFNAPPGSAQIFDGMNFADDDEYDFSTEPELAAVYGADLEREGLNGTVEIKGREVGSFMLVRPYVDPPEFDPEHPDDTEPEEDNVLRVEFGWPEQFISGGADRSRAKSILEWAEGLRV